MSSSHETHDTARRNLIQRIDRYLAAFVRIRRQPNRRESFYARQAMEHLEAGLFKEGDEALIRAKHAAPLPAHVAAMPETNTPSTVEELRAELDRLTQGES